MGSLFNFWRIITVGALHTYSRWQCQLLDLVSSSSSSSSSSGTDEICRSRRRMLYIFLVLTLSEQNPNPKMLAGNCRSPSSSSSSSFPYPPQRSWRSSPYDNVFLKNVLNMSPRLSSYYNPLDTTSSSQASLCWDAEKAVICSSISSVASNGTPTPKSTAQLKEEIAALELEIIHLEHHLLSLYRTAFQGRLFSQAGSREEKHTHRGTLLHHDHVQSSPAGGWTASYNPSPATSLKTASKRDQKIAKSSHRSLADHLGASLIDNALNAPDKLSEDIVRCISSIYCKLANPPQTHAALSTSPTSSLSSSSMFSSKNPCDSWSPHCSEDTTVNLQGSKEDNRPYAALIEVLKIRLEDDNFNYAAIMLQNFRSLVRKLEKVDPRKMKREEKLAFWINIHNALVMHAYLAYGTRHQRVRSASVLKAAYNVGGHCVNAYVIQSSILGIQPHHSSPWLQTLFPGRKWKVGGSGRHAYTLEYPEPLVHFTLCSGASSDPAVRAYTAKNIFEDLKIAKEEFIQGSVYVHKETKLLLPKVLYYFAKDMSLSVQGLLEIVIDSVSSQVQKKWMRNCINRRLDKGIHWLPQSSTFRYFIHADLAAAPTQIEKNTCVPM
nr:uncharacterized protein LOC107404549 isoform X3 [Ziziphus jujuba var. spinosa]